MNLIVMNNMLKIDNENNVENYFSMFWIVFMLLVFFIIIGNSMVIGVCFYFVKS